MRDTWGDQITVDAEGKEVVIVSNDSMRDTKATVTLTRAKAIKLARLILKAVEELEKEKE